MDQKQQPTENKGETAIRRVSSTTLFNGHTQVIIEHKGQDYLLRQTRQDKLILTK